MNADPAIGKREDRDGCDCPPYVERCAHWGGLCVWLVEKEAFLDEWARRGVPRGQPCPHGDVGRNPKGVAGWTYLLVGPGRHEKPRCICRIELTLPTFDGRWATFTDDAAALAAFHRAEQRLLRGDA